MKLSINRLHHPVTALGPGTRAGIWVQGCSIGCRGCIAHDTWELSEDAATDVGDVLDWLGSLPETQLDGVTISGGEPFDQPEALVDLLARLTTWRAGLPSPTDILCYSGYPLRRLQRRHADALELLDAVITEPYRQDLPTKLIWRGSANQQLVPLTALGTERYAPFLTLEPPRPPLQVTVDGPVIRTIGVPLRGDLERLHAELQAAGIDLTGESWMK